MPNTSFNPTEAAQKATTDALKAASKLHAQMETLEPMVKATAATVQALSENPQEVMNRTLKLYQDHMALGASFMEKMMGKDTTPVAAPDKDDKRFTSEGWTLPAFDMLKQSYLLTSRFLHDITASTRDKLDPHTHHQASFYTRVFTDMMSPANNPLTNPDVLATAQATQGQSLLDGMKNLMGDLQQGRVSMTDYEKFKVGETIAVTKGSVVFRNRLIELIQYAPQTETVHAIPILICPPWINRYYILDLQPHNSLVNFLVQQGFRVFMISWKNPDASYRDTTFDDYLREGFMAASDAVLSISGQKQHHTLGYCIGGAMLACATAILNTKKDSRIASAAFLTTLTDYSNPGDLGVFIDEPQLQKLEAKMQRDGVLDGRDMAATFSALRSADLVWSYVINNYMLGKPPAPFDILYWNDDSTRMPAAMHSWYLRNFYLENNISVKGKLKLLDTPLDITNLTQPLYMLSGQADHITPWMGCYKPFAAMKSANKRFVLSKSGHVAGVVNPPTPAGKPVKKTLMTGDATAPSGDAWLKTASEIQDSWWPDYAAWLKPLAGEMVKAPASEGNKTYPPLMPAPGTYVGER